MSESNGTPSKTIVWEFNQYTQILKAFVGILPDVLRNLEFHPKDIIEAFRNKDEDLKQGLSIFFG